MPARRTVTGRSREPRARFAEELRSLRAERGQSLRQLGERLGWDWPLFGKMEKGETVGGPEVVQALDQHYGTPGLLQTPGYAREVLAAGGFKGEELEQQVGARVGRQALLAGDDPPPFRTILSEAVLRMPLRDTAEWRGQLEYLSEAGEQGDVTVQVLPQRAGPHGLVSTDVWFLRLPGGRLIA